MTLAKRSRSVFNTTLNIKFRMSRSTAAPLPEVLDIINVEISCKGENGIQHGRHMPGIKEETIAVPPAHIIRIPVKKFRKQDVNIISTAHGTTGVSRFSLFNHGCR